MIDPHAYQDWRDVVCQCHADGAPGSLLLLLLQYTGLTLLIPLLSICLDVCKLLSHAVAVSSPHSRLLCIRPSAPTDRYRRIEQFSVRHAGHWYVAV